MAQALLRFAHKNSRLRFLHLAVRADNRPAIALYEQLGFQPGGIRRGFLCIDGHYYDELLMNLPLSEEGGATPALDK